MAITDPYSAVFDPLGIEPSGRDCQWAFVGDDIPQQEFKKRWPWAAEVSFLNEKRWNQSGFWISQDTVRIVSYWRMVTEGTRCSRSIRTALSMTSPTWKNSEYINFVEQRSDGSPYIREVPKRFARLYVCSGNAILEGPYDYPISSPAGLSRAGMGIKRRRKDPPLGPDPVLEGSATPAQTIGARPSRNSFGGSRNKWLTTPDAIKGHEPKWRRAPSSDDPFLYYNDGENPPVHSATGDRRGACQRSRHGNPGSQDISNIHEAAFGDAVERSIEGRNSAAPDGFRRGNLHLHR